MFDRRRKYNMPVFMSRHPDLNTYIVKVLQNAKPLFDRGLVRSVVVPILGPQQLVQEIHEFHFSNYVAGPAINLQQLEQAFKLCITRLGCADSHLPRLPSHSDASGGCTFKIVVIAELEDRVVDQQQWVVTDVKSPFHTLDAGASVHPGVRT